MVLFNCILIILSSFFSMVAQDAHPEKGAPYKGTQRKAYLPDCPEGRKVLMLLKVAFDRQLVFTVGQSATRADHVGVIWNDIHHKTDKTCGSRCDSKDNQI